MDFLEYQQVTQRTFKDHEPLTAEQARLLDWSLGLAGESGEILELMKHHIYGGAPLDKMEAAKELGDVLWYLSAMATSLDLRLEDVALLNQSKLLHRYSNEGFSVAESLGRHEREKQFKETPVYRSIEARVLHQTAPMNVIFLGPDGSGKTTIAKRVAQEIGWEYQKCDYRQDNKVQLAKQFLSERENVIYDRFYYPDELVYSQVKQLPIEQSTWDGFLEVEKLLTSLNTLVIYVTANQGTLMKRAEVWADDYVATTQLATIKQVYGEWLRRWEFLRISVFTLDTTDVECASAEFEAVIAACLDAIKVGQKSYSDISE